MKNLFLIIFIFIIVFQVFSEQEYRREYVIDFEDPDTVDAVWVLDVEATAKAARNVYYRVDEVSPGDNLLISNHSPMVYSIWNVYGDGDWVEFVFVFSFLTRMKWKVYNYNGEEYLGIGYIRETQQNTARP